MMSEEVEIKMSEERRLACLDVKGPYATAVQTGLSQLYAWAAPKGLLGGGPPIGIYHDSPQDVAPEELRSTLAIPVPDTVQGEGAVRIEVIPSREEAIYVHKGPYDRLEPAYGKVIEHIFKSGYKIAGPPMEVYISNPMEVPPEELVTEIRFPIARA